MTTLVTCPHQLDATARTCRVVIETPRGSRSKYTFDPKTGGFEIGGLLPEGMSFPLDFGFVPATKAQDGDPLDVLVLYDEPCAVGAMMRVRLLGVIEAEQTEAGKTFRNDRLLAVAEVSRLYEHVRTLDDLGEGYLDQLESFWVQYNALKGKRFKVLSVGDAAAAVAAIRKHGRTPHTR
jgi:inorganic pyrophosphatase